MFTRERPCTAVTVIVTLVSTFIYNAGQKKRNSDPWIFCELPGRGRSTLEVVDY